MRIDDDDWLIWLLPKNIRSYPFDQNLIIAFRMSFGDPIQYHTSRYIKETWFVPGIHKILSFFLKMASAETSTTDDNITINTYHDPKESSSSSPNQCANETTPDQKPRTLFDTIRLVILFIGVILSMFVMSLNSTVVAPVSTKWLPGMSDHVNLDPVARQ